MKFWYYVLIIFLTLNLMVFYGVMAVRSPQPSHDILELMAV